MTLFGGFVGGGGGTSGEQQGLVLGTAGAFLVVAVWALAEVARNLLLIRDQYVRVCVRACARHGVCMCATVCACVCVCVRVAHNRTR